MCNTGRSRVFVSVVVNSLKCLRPASDSQGTLRFCHDAGVGSVSHPREVREHTKTAAWQKCTVIRAPDSLHTCVNCDSFSLTV